MRRERRPENLRDAFEKAARRDWTVRAEQAKERTDAGRLDAATRGEVTGAHLDAMVELVEQLFVDAGTSPDKTHRRGEPDLPGRRRPAKERDLLVLDGDRPVAAIQFTSQVRPAFGNDDDDRCEEAPGSTKDVKIPSTAPCRPDLVFGATPPYKDRYAILLDRLLKDGVDNAACFVTSPADPSAPVPEPVAELSSRNVAAVASRGEWLMSSPWSRLSLDPPRWCGDEVSGLGRMPA